MHHNFYFLKYLSASLNDILIGYELVEAFSQTKDELVLSFLHGKKEFHIKATLDPQYAMLSFPDNFARAKKNSIDLFPELILKKVTHVHQFENERSFALHFESGLVLVFKMHGKRSNVLLFKGEQLLRMFNNQMKYDLEVTPSSLERPIDQSLEGFLKNGIKATFPTFDKVILQELHQRGIHDTPNEHSFRLIEELLAEMAPPFYIYEENGLPFLSLFEQKNKPLLTAASDPIEIANELFYGFTRVFSVRREKEKAVARLNQMIKKGRNYIQKSKSKLSSLIESSRHEEIANIIMANLHQIKEGQERVELFDFYRNEQIEVKLKPGLSPQKNAETWYRKAKNQKIEVQKLEENIQRKSSEVERLELALAELEDLNKLKDLRKKVESLNLTQKSGQKEESLPYRKLNLDGWDLLVGKSAKSNDELTLKHAHKNDLWLHAKDVSGSHVVLRQIAGQKVPEPILEKAAQIAAYYSKRKTDSLCPVIFTPKKYVRKPKGAAPGLVIVDREEVILVQPASPEEVL